MPGDMTLKMFKYSNQSIYLSRRVNLNGIEAPKWRSMTGVKGCEIFSHSPPLYLYSLPVISFQVNRARLNSDDLTKTERDDNKK